MDILREFLVISFNTKLGYTLFLISIESKIWKKSKPPTLEILDLEHITE